jgi:hypothetical protein
MVARPTFPPTAGNSALLFLTYIYLLANSDTAISGYRWISLNATSGTIQKSLFKDKKIVLFAG